MSDEKASPPVAPRRPGQRGGRSVVPPPGAIWLSVSQVAAALQLDVCFVRKEAALALVSRKPDRWPVKAIGSGKNKLWRIHRSVIEPKGNS